MARKIGKDTTSKSLMEIKLNGLKERSSMGLRPDDKGMTLTQNFELVAFSQENFGDYCLTPQGFLDGETGRYHRPFVTSENAEIVDLYGNPISAERWERGDFSPDDIDFLIEEEEEFDFWECPEDNGAGISVYRNPNQLLKTFVCHQNTLLEAVGETPGVVHGDNCSKIESVFLKKDYKENKEYTYWDVPNRSSRGSDKYKERRKGGARITRRKAERLTEILGKSFSLFYQPRVAIVNGTPEEFPLTRRRRIKKMKSRR